MSTRRCLLLVLTILILAACATPATQHERAADAECDHQKDCGDDDSPQPERAQRHSEWCCDEPGVQ